MAAMRGGKEGYMYEMLITAVLNGFSVRIGCQTMVYNSVDTLLGDLGEYLKAMEEEEKMARATAINRRMLGGIGMPMPAACNEQACQAAPRPQEARSFRDGISEERAAIDRSNARVGSFR